MRLSNSRAVWAALVLLSLAGCGDEAERRAESTMTEIDNSFDSASLSPPETFVWGSQPIAASPPPQDWRRERELSGGLRGVRFIKSRSFGEEIRIAEYYELDDRLRCGEQLALLEALDRLDQREFMRSVQRAKFYIRDPINSFERQSAEAANAFLDEARDAFRSGDVNDARRAIRRAINRGQNIRYKLDEVVDDVLFDTASYDSFGQVSVLGRKDGYVGGVPSISVDYTLDSRDNGHLYYGRQVYVLEDNRLFVLTFHGLKHNLPIFEAIVDSVSFPRTLCTF